MVNRTGNYCAFYVKTPFSETNLGATQQKISFITEPSECGKGVTLHFHLLIHTTKIIMSVTTAIGKVL